jgi:hypothetical protein
MKIFIIGLVLFSLTCLLLTKCSKKQEIILNPRLFITLKDEVGNSIPGATVRLYKNAQDPGIIQISDTTGVVIFRNLEPELYYWLAQKGCRTNRNSQNTLGRPLIQDVILYGYSVMSETGTLKITNTSTEPYKISDSLFNITLSNDTPYITYPGIGSYLIHSEKVSTPGIGKDTLIQIRCGDTSIIVLPY